MSCTDIKELIHGYLDGELDLVRSLEIEQHLRSCRVCSQVYEVQQGLHSVLTRGELYFEAPKSLHRSIRSAVREASSGEIPRALWPWPWYAFWAPLATVALVLVIATLLLKTSAIQEHLPNQLLAAQVRSLMPGHLVDIPSSDRNTVKPWFNGKLDFSPPVVDLTGDGFPLAGGRLDYVDNRPVAVVVYHCGKHCINLFMWPNQKAKPSSLKYFTQQGYNMVHWTESGMNCWAVSDVNKGDLGQFVQLLRNQGYSYSPGSPAEAGTNQYKYSPPG